MKRLFGVFLVVLMIAMLSVPIIAKPERLDSGIDGPLVIDADSEDTIQADPHPSDKAVKEAKPGKDKDVEKVTGKAKKDEKKDDIEVVGLKQKELKSKEKHNIRIGAAFSGDGSGDAGEEPKLEKSDGRLKVRVPPGAEVSRQARIKLKDFSGEEVAEIIAEYDLSESDIRKLEKGSASVRSVRSLRLVSKEKKVEVSDNKGNRHRIKAHVAVGLNSINEDSSLDITTGNDLEPEVAEKFEEIAEKNNVRLKDRGGVMKVDKVNLQNGVEVEDARITFKVEPGWIGEENMNNVRILRYDEGFTEMLPTEFAGIDDEGMLIFEGQSDKGLSTFGVFMVENMKPEEEEINFDFGALKGFLLPLLVIVTVGAAFAGSVFRKDHD